MVSHAFPPYSSGGVEVCTADSAIALQERQHEVRIFHRVSQPDRPEYELKETQWQGLRVTTINNTFAEVREFEMTYRNRAIDQAFAAYLNEVQPDLVHFQHLTCLSTDLVRIAREHDIPSVLTLHDYWLVCQRGQMLQPDLTLCAEPEDDKCARCLAPFIYPWFRSAPKALGNETHGAPQMLRRAMGLFGKLALAGDRRRAVKAVQKRTQHVHRVMQEASLLLTPSRFHRDQFVRYGVDPTHVEVLTNGLRTDAFVRRQQASERPSGGVRFFFIGTVMPPKGVHVLLEAFSGLQRPRTGLSEAGDDWATLDIHGATVPYGDYPNYAQELQAQAGSRVRFHGEYLNTQVGDILAHADVVVIPSIWYETFSMVVHEAFLAHVPVIAPRLGALAEFVEDGVNGLLFEPRNVQDLRAKMQRLIDDPGLCQSLAQRPGPVKSIQQQAAELEAIYGRVVSHHRLHRP